MDECRQRSATRANYELAELRFVRSVRRRATPRIYKRSVSSLLTCEMTNPHRLTAAHGVFRRHFWIARDRKKDFDVIIVAPSTTTKRNSFFTCSVKKKQYIYIYIIKTKTKTRSLCGDRSKSRVRLKQRTGRVNE